MNIENMTTDNLWNQRHAIVAVRKTLSALQANIGAMADVGIHLTSSTADIDNETRQRLDKISHALFDRHLLNRQYADPVKRRINEIQANLDAQNREIGRVNTELAGKRAKLIGMGADPAKTIELFPDIDPAEWSIKQTEEKRGALTDMGVRPDMARDLVPDVDTEVQQQMVSDLKTELAALVICVNDWS